jgi:hypothetical protein
VVSGATTVLYVFTAGRNARAGEVLGLPTLPGPPSRLLERVTLLPAPYVALLPSDLRDAEAKQSDLETAEDAALSRLRPIQDGPDQWQEHRNSAGTGSGISAPGCVPAMFEPIWEELYMKCLGQGVNETVWRAFTRVPTRGSLTSLKEAYGP